MKHRPDPLLAAVFAAAEPDDDALLAAALTGARSRRRARALRRNALGLVGLVILIIIASHSVRAPRAESSLVLVHTTSAGLRQVNTSSAGLTIVSTRPGGYEEVSDDNGLLALLPGAAGFIGEPGERRLLWLPVETTRGVTATQ